MDKRKQDMSAPASYETGIMTKSVVIEAQVEAASQPNPLTSLPERHRSGTSPLEIASFVF